MIEASPSYLPTPSALRKMKTVLPNARVIVILRDPVSRAFSHYQHKKTRHLESRSFAEAVEEEIRANAVPGASGAWRCETDAKPMLGYVARGYYALQLELLGKMYRRNRVLVLDSEKLFADTAATCNRVFDYMGLEDFDVEPGKVYNRGFYQEKIDPRVADRLREHYRPYDEMLAGDAGAVVWLDDAAVAVDGGLAILARTPAEPGADVRCQTRRIYILCAVHFVIADETSTTPFAEAQGRARYFCRAQLSRSRRRCGGVASRRVLGGGGCLGARWKRLLSRSMSQIWPAGLTMKLPRLVSPRLTRSSCRVCQSSWICCHKRSRTVGDRLASSAMQVRSVRPSMYGYMRKESSRNRPQRFSMQATGRGVATPASTRRWVKFQVFQARDGWINCLSAWRRVGSR